MRNCVYVLGGRQRQRVLKREEEWTLYDRAVILEVDLDSESVSTRVEYDTPEDIRPGKESSVLFKAGTLVGEKLYTCTSTEVLTYEVPHFKLAGYVSIACFNDLHHVCPTPAGTLLVVNTGLDAVVEVTPEGKVVRQWSVLGEDTWARFSKDIDYRKVLTTKPHRSHPNFVFLLDDEVWVTRGEQRDAICLTRPGERINIGIEFPHDGLVQGEKIYFTTVNGRLVVVNRNNFEIEDVVDFPAMDDSGSLLGWCRGIHAGEGGRMCVGFTRVRKTKFMQNINWVKHAGKDREKPTHIAVYDIAAKKFLKEIDLEKHGLNVIFNMVPARVSSDGPRSV